MNEVCILEHPTTFDEQRLALLCKKSEKLNLTFNVSVQFKIEGAIEPDLFRAALYQVVSPHESMNLTFQQEGNRVTKIVDPVPVWAMPYGYHDFSGSADPLEKAQAVYLQSLDQPFQLFQEVAWRYDLCKIDDTSFIGILTAHHLICDFMSALTIGRSVQAAYHCLSSGIPFVNPLNGTSELQAIEESAAQEEQYFDRYKSEFLQDLEGVQDLRFSETQIPLHKRNFELRTVLFDIPVSTEAQINQLATAHSTSAMAIYLSALEMLIQRQTNRDKFVIGLPVNVRPGKKAIAAIGYLSKPMPLSVDLEQASSHLDLIADNSVQIKKIARRRFFPTGRLYDHAIGERLALPKINVLFNYLDTRELSDPGCNTSVEIIPQGFTHSTMDLWLTVQKTMAGTNVKLEVSKDIFEPQQLPDLQTAYLDILTEICEQPEAPIRKKPLQEQGVDALIAGSFTLDPLEKCLGRFQGASHQPLVAELLPYQQVVQTLLNLDVEAHKEVPCLSLPVRLEDFFKHGDLESLSESALEAFCNAFIQALTFSVSSRKLKHQLLLCPAANTTPLFDKYSTILLERLKKVSGLAVEDLRSFSETAIFNDRTNKVAHIPFETSFYQKLAFFIAKHHYQSTRPTPKVLVLDCDNTLWRGVIGEDGLKGIEITPAHQAFQKQLIACYEQGILLALSSKNNEAEVWEVFDQHPDMLLKRSHIVAHRINWEPKARSIQALRAELNLGMDTFVFIDDNPVEVDQCRAQIPELLAVQFPKEEAAIQTFADYHWAIHHPGKRSTFNRTEAYQVESQRKQVKQQFLSMEDYIAALQVQVHYEWLDASNIERASQLTLRTNQFNLTGERCTVAELQAQLDSGQRQGALLRANDKYGDYGIIGLLLFQEADRVFQVENLLLSCRVLGRGIELHLAQWVLEQALQQGAERIHFKYKDTGRNLPGLQFLKALVQLGSWTTDGLSITAENLQKVNLGTFIRKAEGLPTTSASKKKAVAADRGAEADYLSKALSVFEAPMPAQPAATAIDYALLKRLWLEATHSTELDPHLPFLDHGGSSLECVFLLTAINDAFQIDLSIDEVYAQDTFAKLAVLIESKQASTPLPAQREADKMQVFLQDMELSYEDVPFQLNNPELPQVETPTILLTGATGFVGIHILSTLLQEEKKTKVICLIRSTNANHALERLLRISAEYKVTFSEDELTRIQCISGDLADAALGLSPAEWTALSTQVTKIIHCGANVNFFQNYEQLKPANVSSTRALLKLSVQGLPKQFVYISTVGVFHSGQNLGLQRFEENFATGSPAELPTGYQQSKWVAEKLVARAMERGVQAQVVRLGVIAGNPGTQAVNLSDFFIHFQATIFKMGALPQMRDMDFTPVDFAAKAVVKIMQESRTSGGVFHLVHPQPLSTDTLRRWAKLAGEKMDVLPFEDWRSRFDAYLEQHPEASIQKYAPLFRKRGDRESFIEVLIHSPVVATSRTEEMLRHGGLEFPAITQELMMQYQSSYLHQALLVPDSSQQISDQNNLFWIVETMDGYVEAQPIRPLKDADYMEAFAKGEQARQTFSIDFKGHVKSLANLMASRKVFLNGTIHCPAIDPDPLEVQEGFLQISPFEGYSPGRTDSLVFLSYKVHCVSKTGEEYVMNGFKVSRQVPNMFYELCQVLFTIKAVHNPSRQWVGMIQIPFQELFRDQITKMTFREGLSEKEQLKCQSAWMGILMAFAMKNYMNLTLRDNPVGWSDLREFAKGIPALESMVTRYFKFMKRLKKTGILSKLVDFQVKSWFKKA